MTAIAETRVHGLMVALLPPGLRRLLASAAAAGREVGSQPCLVGGTVRDLLLGRGSRLAEVDLMVEGAVAPLAERLAAAYDGRLTLYPPFGTATIVLPWRRWDDVGEPGRHAGDTAGLSLDLATARREHYARPGALPVVTLDADLATDLRRRDFTLNALAIVLRSGDDGRLVDLYGGLDDLAAGRLAVLHPASFEDDPTRLLRGLRLAGRLWLRFEATTEQLAGQAVARGWLERISGERRWRELALLLDEEQPALSLAMARRLGLLAQIDPALTWDSWLAERLQRALPWPDEIARRPTRLALLAYRWPAATVADFIGRLRPDGATRAVLDWLPHWHERREHLARARTGSAVAELLAAAPLPVLAAARLAEDEATIQHALDWHVLTLRQRRPRLGGAALRQLGLPPGPLYRDILAALRRAVLNGELPDEAAEWAFLRRAAAAAAQASDLPMHE